MRRITVVGMIILGLVAMPLIAAAKPAPEKKTEICHFNGEGVGHTIEVSKKAVTAHLAHGDSEGECTASGPIVVPIAPIADFTWGEITCDLPGLFPPKCTVPLDASASTGDIDTYTWSYTGARVGGGFGVNLKITDVSLGDLLVTLAVQGGGGTDVISKVIALEAP